MPSKLLKLITQILLLSVIAIVPFLKTNSLYFPYVSGKVYVFRLLVALAFFFWAWLILKEKEYRPGFKNILLISLVLFFLSQVLVSFFGVDSLLSFFSTIERGEGVLQYGFWVLYFLMLVSVFRVAEASPHLPPHPASQGSAKEGDWKLLFSVFIIVAILSSLYSWFNYSSQIRLYAIFGNSSYLAVFLLFAIGFAFIILERKFFKNIFWKVFISLAILFFIITLVATQTRGAYFGLAGGVFLFCFLAVLFLRKENKKLALFCGIALAVGLIATIALFAARETNFVQNTYILKRTTSVAKLWEDDVVRERLLTWQVALKGFKERPVFGYGPENFGSAFNKYYDYRIGIAQPWFDRAHSQPIDTLATGGIVLFSFYLFWLAVVFYCIFKISRKKKILSFILASIFLAYFLQGLFLFDLMPVYLGLFPFLAFVASRQTRINTDENASLTRIHTDKNLRSSVFTSVFIRRGFLTLAAFLSLFAIYTTVFLPYKANAAALQFYGLTENGVYQKAKPFLGESYEIKSPYTFWEVRKRTGWQLITVLDYSVDDKTDPEDINALKEIYDYITPELERFMENRPFDPQIYFILGRTYRLGFEKLGKQDLDKAEKALRKGFNYSDSRAEYFNELVQVLILGKKFDEAEILVKEYLKKIPTDDYLSYLITGHLYFMAEKYEEAMEYYEKAKKEGYKFYEDDIDYSRYMSTAEHLEDYQKIVDTAQAYLERWGPDADTFFNIAVGYLNLGEKEKAKEFFLKAVELKEEYEEYRPFFAP